MNLNVDTTVVIMKFQCLATFFGPKIKCVIYESSGQNLSYAYCYTKCKYHHVTSEVFITELCYIMHAKQELSYKFEKYKLWIRV